jgi:putative Holliday junction resolvase
LAIDWGEKRLGLGIGDSETKLATPFETIKNIKELVEIIDTEEIDEIILGEPIKMRGNKDDMHPLFRTFFEALKTQIHIPIHLVDERLSSQGADALVGNASDKAGRDEVAAMIVLQNYLDRLNQQE